MKRLASLLLLCLFSISVFAACDKGSVSNTDNAASEQSSKINYAEEGFSIIRPDGSDDLIELSSGIFKAVRDATSQKLTNTTDATEPNSAGEILIGNTNRPQSKKAIELIREKGTGRAAEYIVCVIDGNIVINALSDEALEKAVQKFISDYAGGSISADLCDVFVDDGKYETITVGGVEIGKYTFVARECNESFIVTRRIQEIIDKVYDKTGYKMAFVRDNETEAEYEIIVGACERDGVEDITSHDEYEVRFEGTKIYINGGRNYAIANGLEDFEARLSGAVSTENISGNYNGGRDGDYSLVFKDEFNKLDTRIWLLTNDKEYKNAWYGKELYRSSSDKNVYVKDGRLYLAATYDDKAFYGSMVRTKYTLNFTYGYTEMSAILADGDGIWHCFWVYGAQDDRLELDIMECWSGADSYMTYIHEAITSTGQNSDIVPACNHFTVKGAFPSYNDFINGYVKGVRDYDRNNTFANEFHTYGVEWTEQDVTFYRDGTPTVHYNYVGTPAEFLYRQEAYIMFSMLTGSNLTGLTEAESDAGVGIRRPVLGADYWQDGRQNFVVEYVQLYQKEGQYRNDKTPK